jgi:hypothetical protein
MNRRGLTLVEVLVIIFIVGVLVCLLVPVTSRPYSQSRRSLCRSNLRDIGKGCIMYSADFGDYYPSVRVEGTTDSRPLKSLSLLFDTYVPVRKIFVCPSTMDSCEDLKPGQSFLPHARGEPQKAQGRFGCGCFLPQQEARKGERRRCSYAYDDTRDPKTSPRIVIAGDAPPSLSSGRPGEANTRRNSDNHAGEGQNILFYGSDEVMWIPNAENPMIASDDIYTAADPKNPGASDSYIHQ